MALKPTVLLYNFTDKRRRNKVSTYCAMHGIRVRAVERTSYEKPLLTLVDKEAEVLFEGTAALTVGEEGEREQAPEQMDFADEMLVMCNVGSQMNPFLSYLRKEKVIVPLKAVLTPTNQFWNSVELYTEIRQEHEQMAGQR
ncbi:MAG: DUF3783 domain-containing protein [Eubacteriales bacterium]|nr:DUF3783 domain-containing protein [Eubacteriales bacterium]